MIWLLVLLLAVAGVVFAALQREFARRRRAAAHDRFVAQLQDWLSVHAYELTPWQRQFLTELYAPGSTLIRRYVRGR